MLRYCDSLKALSCLPSAHFFPTVDCLKENMCPLANAAHLLYDTSYPDVWPASQLITTLDAIDPSSGDSPPHVHCSSSCSAFFGTYLLLVFLDASCLFSSTRDFSEPTQQSCCYEDIHWKWQETVKVHMTSPFLLPLLTTASWAVVSLCLM